MPTNKMNLTLDVETQDKIKTYAKKKHTIPSKIIKELIDKYLTADDFIPVILKIPSNLKGDEENLKKWLEPRVDTIIKTLVN